MIRNEYRRAFIMLRSVMPGYGGHVRLERRTLTGSMYFIVTAPQGVGELSAALVGRQNGEYYAAPIGPLTRDRRGQLTLAWQFDPRGIEGRPLEAYPWVAVVATGGPCALALTGNVEGSRPADLQALARAACALFAPAEQPAADLPEADQPAADLPVEEQPAPAGEAPHPETASDQETQGDVRVYTLTRTRLRREQKPAAVPAPEPEAEPAAGPQPEASTPQPEVSTPEPEAPTPEPVATTEPETMTPGPVAEPQPAAGSRTAAQLLGLDITAPWPAAAEALRRLFATQPPAEDAPGDGYTYVRVPMPAASGYRESLAGLKAEDGRITGIRTALPGRRAPEPPAGLDGCRWVDADGEQGFWVTDEAFSSNVELPFTL